MSRDAPQAPLLAIEPSREASAGAAASYLMRKLSSQAGCYAPGIQDRLFQELLRTSNGAGLDQVASWFSDRMAELHRLGYRLAMQRVAFRTPAILRWVEGGSGYRGAVLTTVGGSLRPEVDQGAHHAVAVAQAAQGKKRQLLLVDPWPGAGPPAGPPETLETAHRGRNYGTLVVYWSGYS